MALSAEIRFWWRERNTNLLTAWLHDLDTPLCCNGERSDVYFATNNEVVNLKRRSGETLEIKSYVQKLPLSAAFGKQEHAEIWVKYELSGASLSGLNQIKIRKKRWLAYLDEAGRVTARRTGSENSLGSGCQIEVSEISLGNQSRIWSSFCLEAFGVADFLANRLVAAIQKLGTPPAMHQEPMVASYAKWLKQQEYRKTD